MAAHKWLVSEETALIHMYRDHEVLWNPKHANYYKRDVKDAVFRKIADQMLQTCCVTFTKAEMQRKIKMLRISFQREERKVTASKKSGASASSIHTPKWIHYNDLQFLRDSLQADDSIESFTASLVTSVLSETPDNESVLSESSESEMTYPRILLSMGSAAPSTSMQNGTSLGEDTTASTIPARKRAHISNLENAKTQFFSEASRVLQTLSGSPSKAVNPSTEEVFGNYVTASLETLNDSIREDCKLEIFMILNRYLKER